MRISLTDDNHEPLSARESNRRGVSIYLPNDDTPYSLTYDPNRDQMMMIDHETPELRFTYGPETLEGLMNVDVQTAQEISKKIAEAYAKFITSLQKPASYIFNHKARGQRKITTGTCRGYDIIDPMSEESDWMLARLSYGEAKPSGPVYMVRLQRVSSTNNGEYIRPRIVCPVEMTEDGLRFLFVSDDDFMRNLDALRFEDPFFRSAISATYERILAEG